MNESQFVNRNKLRGAMAEYGIKSAELAERLSLTRQSLSTKLNGKGFSEHEIATLKEVFGLTIFIL